MNIQGRYLVGWTGWISLQSKELSHPSPALLQSGGRPSGLEATGDRQRPVQGRPPPFSFFLSPFPSPPPSARRGAGPQVPGCVCVSAEKVFASLPQVERGVSKIVGGDPKGNNFLYTNGKCVILRNIDVSTSPPPLHRPPPGCRFFP